MLSSTSGVRQSDSNSSGRPLSQSTGSATPIRGFSNPTHPVDSPPPVETQTKDQSTTNRDVLTQVISGGLGSAIFQLTKPQKQDLSFIHYVWVIKAQLLHALAECMFGPHTFRLLNFQKIKVTMLRLTRTHLLMHLEERRNERAEKRQSHRCINPTKAHLKVA